jgi:hypothetical protein
MATEGRARLRLESGPMAVRTWTALSPRAQQRALEIAPGALTWTVLLIPLIVAFAIRFNDPADLWIIGLGAVLLDAYWFLRTAVTVYWVWRSLQQLRRVEAGDWWAECERMETPEGAPGPNDITHCALIPTYTERYEVLRATVEALADQRYPDQLKVCAIITRATDIAGCDNVRRLQSELGHRFRAFIHIKDPLLPGIVVGKSAAMSYGGPVLRQPLRTSSGWTRRGPWSPTSTPTSASIRSTSRTSRGTSCTSTMPSPRSGSRCPSSSTTSGGCRPRSG